MLWAQVKCKVVLNTSLHPELRIFKTYRRKCVKSMRPSSFKVEHLIVSNLDEVSIFGWQQFSKYLKVSVVDFNVKMLDSLEVRRWIQNRKVMGSKPNPCEMRVAFLAKMWTQWCLSPTRSINRYLIIVMSAVYGCSLLCKKWLEMVPCKVGWVASP